MTWFDWIEAKVDRLRATTAADPSTAGADGQAAKALTPEEHVRHCLGMDEAAQRADARPTLVYFHWPHEDPVDGKRFATLCLKVLDDEGCARWGRLFRCVQVDMSSSDPRMLALLGAGEKPVFAVYGAEATKPLLSIPAQPSPAKMAKALEDALGRIPSAKQALDAALAAHAKSMAEAKALAKQDRLEEALAAYDRVRRSDVRVTPLFDKAAIEAAALEERIARARK